jgi:hypothetical protein
MLAAWPARAKQQFQLLPPTKAALCRLNNVLSAALSPIGRRIVTASADPNASVAPVASCLFSGGVRVQAGARSNRRLPGLAMIPELRAASEPQVAQVPSQAEFPEGIPATRHNQPKVEAIVEFSWKSLRTGQQAVW